MDEEEEAGIGCIGAILVLALIGWVLQNIVAILIGLLLLAIVGATVTGIGVALVAAIERAAERSRCPVCKNWATSVLLTDLGPDSGPLCKVHAQRLDRISALERETLDGN